MKAIIAILLLAFLQNVSFSIVSRSRNRSNFTYHMVASVFSNGVWFLTFRQLVLMEMDWVLFVPYTLGTVIGSLTGAKVSMWIERRVGAGSDDHLHRPSLEQLVQVQVEKTLARSLQVREQLMQELATPSTPPSTGECGYHINGPIYCNLPPKHVGGHNRRRPAGTVIS